MNRVILIEKTIRRFKNRLKRLEQTSRLLSWLRLSIVIISLITGLMALYFSNNLLSYITVAFFLSTFISATILHGKLKKSIQNHNIRISIKYDHIARAKVDWDNIPDMNFKLAADHPFAFDLDITGSHSLHRLMDNTTTSEGSQILAHWLLDTKPDLNVIKQRQRLITEIKALSRFRDKLTQQAKIVSRELFDGLRLNLWLKNNELSQLNRYFMSGITITALSNIILFILNQTGIIPPYYFITLSIYILFFLSKAKLINKIFMDAITLSDELKKCSNVLSYLEHYPFHKQPAISELMHVLHDTRKNPSGVIRKLLFVLILFGIRANIFMQILLNIIFPIDYYLTYRFLIEKKRIAALLPGWLDVWYEMEAISALANFAYLNPEYQFPQISDQTGINPVLRVRRMGHPLIRKENKICNDFDMMKPGEIMLITGSNMSGKSTFLRTIGINLSLAFAGSVVNAASFSTLLFRLYTCIRISDNLNEGLSYFYAEVKRLRQILDHLNADTSYPLFFLIDEIYKGTNNRERLEGSRAYIKSLASGKGLGFVSTHDLELTALSKEQSSIHNFHFKEHIENGKMVFDYKIHPGPCPTTNALKIMEMEGLPVN